MITKILLSALLGIFNKLFTQKYVEKTLTILIIAALKKLATKTTNTVDDELVKDMTERLEQEKEDK